MKPKSAVALVVCLAIPLAVGALSGLATVSGLRDWYPGLAKPSFNPPNGLFGPVWTTLYLLMGVSLYLIWRAPPGPRRRRALAIFWTQLALNFAWSFLFFRFRLLGTSLIEIVLIWAAILLMIVAFSRIRAAAAYLQIPYLLWVSFAALLNAGIWRLN